MFKTLLAATAATFILSGATLADQPGSDWMSKHDVMQQMEQQGFSGIVMEADDGRWEGLAVKDGRIVKFHADPHTGKITKLKPKTKD
jgi:hypothetical protein